MASRCTVPLYISIFSFEDQIFFIYFGSVHIFTITYGKIARGMISKTFLKKLKIWNAILSKDSPRN